MHTIGFSTLLINTGAHNHDIVDDRETTFATNPFTGFAHDIAVCQHSGFVHDDAATVKFLGVRKLIFGEELPGGAIDNLIWGVAKNVDD